MTVILATSTVVTKDLKVGDLIQKPIGYDGKILELGILAIAPSNPGERDFKLAVTSPTHKAPHNYYAFSSDEWEKVGEIDVDAYWQEFNSKKAIEPLFDQAKHDYLAEYNKRVSVLQQLTLAENDARIETYNQRDWWGNPLTSTDTSEHLWSLYQRETLSGYKHFYLKMFAQSKGVKLPKYDRDPLPGFPLFTGEQIKELESIHE